MNGEAYPFGGIMWYTLQVKKGQEEYFCQMIQEKINKKSKNTLIQECFFLQRERMKKFGGRFHKVQEIVFPPYIFVHTNQEKEVNQLFEQTPELNELLHSKQDNSYFTPLQKEEVDFILRWGDETHLLKLSVIRVNKDKTVEIIDGSLKNYKKELVKLDLHRRTAIIQTQFLGEKQEIHLGFQIMGKDL